MVIHWIFDDIKKLLLISFKCENDIMVIFLRVFFIVTHKYSYIFFKVIQWRGKWIRWESLMAGYLHLVSKSNDGVHLFLVSQHKTN